MKNLIKGEFLSAVIIDPSKDLDIQVYNQVKALCDERWLEGAEINVYPNAKYREGLSSGVEVLFTDRLSPEFFNTSLASSSKSLRIVPVDPGKDFSIESFNEHLNSGSFKVLVEVNLLDMVKNLRYLRSQQESTYIEDILINSYPLISNLISLDSDDNTKINISIPNKLISSHLSEFYQKKAKDDRSTIKEFDRKRIELMRDFQLQDKLHLVPRQLNKLNDEYAKEVSRRKEYIPYLVGSGLTDYLNDISVIREFSFLIGEMLVAWINDYLLLKESTNIKEVIVNKNSMYTEYDKKERRFIKLKNI